MTDFEFRRVEASDQALVNQLFEQVFQKQRPLELQKWLYEETKGGPGLGVVATVEDTIVAHAGLVRRPIWLGKRKAFSGQSIDAMTAPGFQRKGLNQQLQGVLKPMLDKAQVELVYGFSNENSTPGILKHQGRVELGPFPLLAKWISARNAVRGRGELPAPRAALIPDDYQSFHEPEDTNISVNLTKDYLRWRYRKPGTVYREVILRERGALQGMGILAIRKQAGVRAGFICDVLAPRHDQAIQKQIVQALVREARESGCAVVVALAYPTAPNRSVFSQCRFLPVPRKLQLEHVVFSARAERPADESIVYEPQSWNLTWGLHDLV